MADLLHIVRKLIPFATPHTPLIQDLLYTAAIAACALVFLVDRYQRHVQERDENPSSLGVNQQDGQETQLEQDNDLEDEVENEVPRGTHHGEEQAPGGFDEDVIDETERGIERDFARQQEQPVAGDLRPEAAGRPADDLDAGEGPANGVDRSTTTQRAVGAKKAKSLAKKDQRRAYHEFLRSQGDAQRAQDASTAAERDAALQKEQSKRAAAEAAIESRKAREREVRREAELREREYEARRRAEPVAMVRRELAERGMCSLWAVVEVLEKEGFDLDVEFVEKLLKLAGVLGKDGFADDGSLTVLTSKVWVVRVTTQDMKAAYQITAERYGSEGSGKISPHSFADALESAIRQRIIETEY
jgi:hypothetical protein